MITRMKMGDGNLQGQNPAELTDLIHTVTEVEIDTYNKRNNYVSMRGVFSNQSLEAGFYWREFGVFAQDPDRGEILLFYANAGEQAEFINSADTSEIVKKLTATLAVDDAQNIRVVTGESIVYALQEDLEYLRQLLNLINEAAAYKTLINVTIPVEAWVKVSETGRYGWKAVVANDLISGRHIPDMTLDHQSLVPAFEAGISPTVETEDGKLSVWAQVRPAAALTGTCILWGGGNGGTASGGDSVIPIASYDRLGIVQISSGLNITDEGKLSAQVATDEEFEAMLNAIYGEEAGTE